MKFRAKHTMLYIVFITFGFCVISVAGMENSERERVASLIVLPPIVLGYDELYDELSNKKSPPKLRANTETVKPNIKNNPPPFKKLNLPWDQLVAYEDPRSEDSIIIPQQRLLLQRRADGRINVQNSKINPTLKPFKTKTDDVTNSHKRDCKYYKKEVRSDNKELVNGSIPNVESIKNNDINETVNANETNASKTDKDSNGSNSKVDDHISMPAEGAITDPLGGDTLKFHGKFVLPNKLFDCPCNKDKS